MTRVSSGWREIAACWGLAQRPQTGEPLPWRARVWPGTQALATPRPRVPGSQHLHAPIRALTIARVSQTLAKAELIRTSCGDISHAATCWGQLQEGACYLLGLLHGPWPDPEGAAQASVREDRSGGGALQSGQARPGQARCAQGPLGPGRPPSTLASSCWGYRLPRGVCVLLWVSSQQTRGRASKANSSFGR